MIGCWMGITPGGPTAASFMSYAFAKRLSRRKDRFRQGRAGRRRGAGNRRSRGRQQRHSADARPRRAGIGDGRGDDGRIDDLGPEPGPMLFIERPDFVWGLIASMYLGNIVAVLVVLATIPIFASILRIPFAIIGPVIVVVCFIGAYTVAGRPFDLWLALGLRCRGLRFQEARLSHRAAGSGDGAGRQGRGRVPAIDDHVEGLAFDLLVERPCRHADHPRNACWPSGLFSARRSARLFRTKSASAAAA